MLRELLGALGSRRRDLGPALIPVNRTSHSAFLNLSVFGWKSGNVCDGASDRSEWEASRTVVGTKELKGAADAECPPCCRSS